MEKVNLAPPKLLYENIPMKVHISNTCAEEGQIFGMKALLIETMVSLTYNRSRVIIDFGSRLCLF